MGWKIVCKLTSTGEGVGDGDSNHCLVQLTMRDDTFIQRSRFLLGRIYVDRTEA